MHTHTHTYIHTHTHTHTQAAVCVLQVPLKSESCHSTDKCVFCLFQLLLLADLYSTRMCNSLLVPQPDEDQIWTQYIPHKRKNEGMLYFTNH